MINELKKYVYLLIGLAFLMPSISYAQGVFGSGAQKIPTIQFERDNKYMATLLSLQNQNALLEKMISRQKELNKMAENLSELNMPFVPPAPEQSICKQLPGNDLCAEFYPSLYKDYNVATAMPDFIPLPLPVLPNIEDIAVVKGIGELDIETLKSLEFADFMWTEINCLNMACKATVVPDISKNRARYTIRIGDRLPNGLVVEKISAEGVVTSRGEKPVILEPAPSSMASQKSVS